MTDKIFTIRTDWSTFETFAPNLYEFSKCKQPSYSFYIHDNHGEIAIVDPKNNLVMVPSFVTSLEAKIRENFSNIQEIIDAGDVVLVDYSKEKPQVLYNYTTKERFCNTSYTPPKLVEGIHNKHILAFDSLNTPVRIPITKLAGVMALNITERMLYAQTVYTGNLTWFFDTLFFAFTIDFDKRDQKDIEELISPVGYNKLAEEQTEFFTKLVQKELKPKLLPANVDRSSILLTQLLDNNIPKGLEGTVDVELDIHLSFSEYFIKEVKYQPETNRILFYVKSSPDDYDPGKLSELLGHDNFSITYIG